MFEWIFSTYRPKMARWGQNRGGVVRYWPQRIRSFGGYYLCANFGENRSRNATVRVRTRRHTQTAVVGSML